MTTYDQGGHIRPGQKPAKDPLKMIRIEITSAAYAALCAGVPPERRLPAEPSPSGGFYLWLNRMTLNKFMAARGPGESYSDVILRFASEAA